MPPANHGTPASPASAYRTSAVRPRLAPSVVPTSSAAKVWPVTGTGEPGTGTEIWAARPVSAAPPSTSATSRTRDAGRRSARTSRGRAMTAAVLMGTPGSGQSGDTVTLTQRPRIDHRQRSTKGGTGASWAPHKGCGLHRSGRDAGHGEGVTWPSPSRPSVAVWAAVARFASFADMVAQSRNFSSRRHVDLRRVCASACHLP